MNRFFSVIVASVVSAASLIAQEQQSSRPKYIFSLEDVIALAKEQSPQAIMARHSFRASFFSFRAYKADYLPKLTLTTSPIIYNHSIRRIESIEDGEYKINDVEASTLGSTAGLSLSQNIGLTGGRISLGSDFSQIQNLKDTTSQATQFTTSPIRLSFSQPLNGYNELRWQNKIEPVRYDEAKQQYIASMELVSSSAVFYFYDLALAQINLNMARTNFANSKELYEISQGRYNIGTIAEDALLQMELKFMQAESKLNSASIDIEVKQSNLRSFLGFKDNVEIELLINPRVPNIKIPMDKALDYALSRSPEIISYNRQLLEAEQTAARAKSQKGITLDMSASYGLNKKAYEFENAYSPKFASQEGVSLGIRIPILDWSQAKDRYRYAQSQLEVIEIQMQQAETDFKQNIYLKVKQFNMQEDQLRIAAKADTIAQKGYEVSKQRYLIGKVSVTDLNIADSDKDNAKKNFLSELQTFWNYYFTLRRLTLFDFLNDRPLEEDFNRIIGE